MNQQVKAVSKFGSQLIYENKEIYDITVDSYWQNFDTAFFIWKSGLLQEN